MSKARTIRAHARQAGEFKFNCEHPVTINAEASADGKRGPAKFDVVAYTGAEMTVEGYDLPIVVDLATAKNGKSVVANLDHKREQRVGHVTETRNDGKQLEFAGAASASTAYRDEVVNSAIDGFAWQASIEAKPSRVDIVKRGESVQVNGRTFSGPIYVARGAVVRGFAFVSHGADDNTIVNIAASAASNHGDRTMTPELKAFIASLTPESFDIDALTDTQIKGWEANFKGQSTPPPEPKAPPSTAKSIDDVVAAQKAENARQEELTDIGAQMIAANPSNMDTIQALTKRAIVEGKTPEQLKAHLWDLAPTAVTISTPRRHDLTQDVVEAAVCMTGGLPDLEKKFDPKVLEIAASHKELKGGITLKQLLCMDAEQRGERVSRNDIEAMLRAAFPPRDIRAAGFSTLSVPNILSNTANKFLMASFNAVESSWRDISARRSVNDFKTVTSYRLTGAFQYEKVGAGGELKHGTVGESTFTNSVDTYGKMFAVTRRDIINDDLGALTQIPARLGRGSALSINDVFWTAFLDDATPFPTGDTNLNYYADAAANLSAASLKVLVRKFQKQVDEDGKPLAIEPRILLVPPEEEITAMELMSSVSMNTGGAASTAQVPNANVYRNRFRVVMSRYLSNSSYTGYSTTAWWLLADPMDLPLIEVAFLNGKDTPTVDTAEADFSTLGIQYRGYHDFGVAFVDYRAGQKSKGAS